MIHPDTEVLFINDEKGYGLFATRPIARGTITWTLDELDRIITPEEMDRQIPLYREILLKYSFRNNEGNYVFCWDNGRYINHSFKANCCQTPYACEIATKNIEPGEELTDDYGYLNIIEPFQAIAEEGDRTMVFPDDLLRYADRWDEKLAAAFPYLLKVEQPLQKFVREPVWQTLQSISLGNTEMASIRSCYYDPNSRGQRIFMKNE